MLLAILLLVGIAIFSLAKIAGGKYRIHPLIVPIFEQLLGAHHRVLSEDKEDYGERPQSS